MPTERHRARRFALTAAAAALSLGALGVAESGAQTAGAAAKANVVIKGSSTYRFSPKTFKVRHGHRVTWRWNSNEPHNVTFHKLHKHSKTGDSGSFKLRFAKRGTYRYECTIHGFTGKIVVK